MPPVVAFLTTVGTFVTAGVAVGSAAAVIGTLVVASAVMTAAMLMGKVDMGVADTDRVRQTTVRGTIEPRKLVYGETMISGVVSFAQVNGANNKNLHQVIAIAGHKLTSIDKIFFDDYSINLSTQVDASGDVTSGKFAKKTNEDGVLETMVHIETRDGSSTQTAYSDLVTAFAGTGVNAGKGYESTHRGDNVASIYTRWTLHEGSVETWDEVGGIQNIKAVVKGKAIYDPRLDVAAGNVAGANPTTAAYITYSNGSTTATHQRDLQGQNPALILADYLMDSTFGLGLPSTKIDWTAVITAADACDFLVPIPTSQTQKRFFGSGVIFGSDNHRKSISKILSGMNGDLIYSQGKYIIKAGVHEAASLAFTEDDLAGDFTVKTSIPRADRFNTIKGMFIDPDSNYKMTEFAPRTVSGAVARDNGEVLEEEIKLTFTSNRYVAQRIAIKQVHQSFLQTTLMLPVNLKGMKVAVGDRITLALNDFATISSDWNPNKEFKVIGWSFSESGSGAIELSLIEDDSSRYADPAEGDYNQISNTGVITSSLADVPLPTSFTATAGYNSVNLAWTNPTDIGAWEQIWIYASDTTTPPTTPIEKFRGTAFTHQIAGGTTKYYWIQAVKYPLGATPASGSTNTSKSALVPFGAPDAVTALKIANAVMDNNSIDTAQIITDAVGSAQIAQTLESDNWATTSGASGWQINKSGSATFQTATIKGGITATSGTIGGFTIGSTDLIAGDGATRVSLSTADGISLGNNTFSNAPFRVTRAGVLTATSGSIGNSVTVGGTAASTVASDSAAGNQAADQISLLPRADDSEWTVGTGAKGIWSLNGDTSENAVVVETGPHGELERIWKATSTDGSGADGGFQNSSTANRFPIVSDTTYRFSVFIKQDNTNGTVYLGAYNYDSSGSTISLYKYDGSAASTNKYWFSSDLPTQGEWYLLVGFINPSNTNSYSGKGGIYNLSTGVKVTAFNDFRFSGDGSEADATTFAVRTYNYYATASPTSIVRWAHPRVDRLDRRAPSIAELLRGWTSLAEPINAGVTITGGGITMSNGGSIKGGQTAFNTGTGFFLGYDATSPAGYKFSVGNVGNNSLTFEDGALSVSGTVNASAGAFTGDVSTDSKFIAGSGDATTVIDGAASATYRIFSGAAQAESENAPFQVKPDGSVFAKNITVFDSSGNILLNQDGLGAAALAGISLTSGTAVDKVSGVLSGDGGEMTLTLDQTATVTLETKFAIYDNSVGTLYLRGTGATSSAALSDITNATLNIVYSLQTDGGSYSTAATKSVTFTSTDSTPSATEVYVTAIQVGGSYLTILMDAGGALEYIANTATYGATAYVVTSHTFTNLPAGVHKVKLSSTITGSGSPDAAGQSTSNRLYELTSSAINFVESAANVFANGTPSVPTGGGTVSGNLVITGDLTVNGTTTTVDTDNLTVKDNNITLNYSTGDSSSTANNAGITIQDAVDSTTDASILWKTASDTFEFSHKLKAPNLDINKNVTTTSANGVFDVSQTLLGNIHITNGAGVSGSPKEAAITFQGGSATQAQAGIYVVNDDSTGTYMAFATADNYSTGPKIGLQIDNVGKVQIPRAHLIVGTGSTEANLDIQSSTWAEINYFIDSTEHFRAGVAVANTTYNTALGDYYLYSAANNNMRLIVPVDGSALTRNNGAITIIDSGNYSSYALPLSGGTLTGSLSGTDVTLSGHLKVQTTGNIGAPDTDDHNTGTRITLYDGSASSWYALGIESATMWFTSDAIYKFYEGEIERLHISNSYLQYSSSATSTYQKIKSTYTANTASNLSYLHLETGNGASGYIIKNGYGTANALSTNELYLWNGSVAPVSLVSAGDISRRVSLEADGSFEKLVDTSLGSTFVSSTTASGRAQAFVVSKGYVAGDYVSLIEAPYSGGANADVRIAARFENNGSSIVFGTSNSYGYITHEPLRLDYRNNVFAKHIVGGEDAHAFTPPIDQDTGYSNHSFGALGILHRNSYDAYLTYNSYYYKTGGSSTWRAKYANYHAGYLTFSSGLLDWIVTSTAPTASGAIINPTSKFSVNHEGNVVAQGSITSGAITPTAAGSANTYAGVIKTVNTSSDQWAHITLGGSATNSVIDNTYIIGRGSSVSARELSFHVPNASVYSDTTQPKFRFASTGSDTLMTITASTGAVYVKGDLSSASISTGNITSTTTISGTALGVSGTSSTTGKGISLYGGAYTGQPTYGIMFQGTGTFGTHGNVTASWATYFTMDSTAGRGWIFRDVTNGNKASISNQGNATFDGTLTAGGQFYGKRGTQVGEDGTYGSYGVLGFGGITNGYNRVFGHPSTGDGLFLAAATGRGVYVRTNGTGVDAFSFTPAGSFLVGSAAEINSTGTIATGSGTGGALALTDRYSPSTGDNLANIGWLRSSGGTYISYGAKQSGSASWVSTYDNFSGKRNYVAFDEDSVTMVFAPAQQTTVGNSITGLAEKFKFDLNTALFTSSNAIQASNYIQVVGANAPNSFAYLNLGYSGSGETRAIDIDGGWSSGESKSISFTHGSTTSNMVGQINCIHNNPSSSIRFGRLFHGGDSSAYPMELQSFNTATANLIIIAPPTGTTAANDEFEIDTSTKGALHVRGAEGGTAGSADTVGLITIPGSGSTIQGGIYASQNSSTGTSIAIFATNNYGAGGYQTLSVYGNGNVAVNRGDLNVNQGITAEAGGLVIGADAYSASTAYVGLKTATMTGTTDYMIIAHNGSDGNTYISAKAGYGPHIRGGANRSSNEIQVPDNTYIRVTTSNLQCTGNVTAYYSSDRSLKENIRPITSALDKVHQINGVYFDWKDDFVKEMSGDGKIAFRKDDVGVIAQEVNEVLNEVVAERKDGTLAVKYEKMVPLLIEAIKEQTQMIKDLQTQLKEIKNGND